MHKETCWAWLNVKKDPAGPRLLFFAVCWTLNLVYKDPAGHEELYRIKYANSQANALRSLASLLADDYKFAGLLLAAPCCVELWCQGFFLESLMKFNTFVYIKYELQ